MNKKIISILFIFIILFSSMLIYIYINQSTSEEKQYDGSTENVTDEDITNEIDELFLDEDGEIEIGEMV